MAINFPNSPTNGQIFTSGGKSYEYNSTTGVWNRRPEATSPVPADVSDLTDTTNVIPTDVSDLTDTTNIIPSLTGYATETYVDTSVANLVDSAPATLDTLNELAAALGDDPNFATTITNQIAAAGGNKVDIVASGALANGDKIIINADGTVSAVVGSTAYSVGTATNFATGQTLGFYHHICYDEGQDKFLILYKNANSNYALMGVVGTVSGGNISFGTPTALVASGGGPKFGIGMVYHPTSQKIFILHHDVNGKNVVGVATISGTSVSFTTTNVPFNTTDICYDLAMTLDINSGHLIAMCSQGNSREVRYCLGVVSGSTVTWQSIINSLYRGTEDNVTELLCIASNGSGKVLSAFHHYNYAGIRAELLTISGTTLSLVWSNVLYPNTPTSDGVLIWVPQIDRFFFAMEHLAQIRGFLISVSSTAWTKEFGPTTNSGATNTNDTGVSGVLHSADGMPYIVYADSGNIKIRKVTCTGNTISYGSTTTLATSKYWARAGYDPDNESIVTLYNDNQSGTAVSSGTAIVMDSVSTTNLTATNFIGISDGAYANTATATIQIAGSVDDAQSGLTAGQAYYVQNDGSLGTGAGNPSVFAGTAISSTKLIVKG